MLSRDETSMIIFKSIDRMKEVSKMEQNNPWAVIGKLNLCKIFWILDLNRSFRYIMGSEGYRLHYVVTKLDVAGIL